MTSRADLFPSGSKAQVSDVPTGLTGYRCKCGITAAFHCDQPHEEQAAVQGGVLVGDSEKRVYFCSERCFRGEKRPVEPTVEQRRCVQCGCVSSWTEAGQVHGGSSRNPPVSTGFFLGVDWICSSKCNTAQRDATTKKPIASFDDLARLEIADPAAYRMLVREELGKALGLGGAK